MNPKKRDGLDMPFERQWPLNERRSGHANARLDKLFARASAMNKSDLSEFEY